MKLPDRPAGFQKCLKCAVNNITNLSGTLERRLKYKQKLPQESHA